jgi:hypothetical protein
VMLRHQASGVSLRSLHRLLAAPEPVGAETQ